MNRPRILIVENSVAVTGALKAILNSAYRLRDQVDFQFVLPKNSSARSKVESFGFPVVEELDMVEIRKNLRALLLYVPYLIRNAIKLRRLVKENNIDVIHVNDLYNLIVPMARLLGLSIPYVSHIRFLPNRFPRALFSFWMNVHLRYAEKLIAVSETLKSALPDNPKIEMIYDSLEVNERLPDRSGNQNSKVFLYLANFIPGKGQDYGLAAFVKIHERISDWRMRFVGDDMGLEKNKTFLEQLKVIAQTSKVEKKIDWLGFTDDVESEYKASDIVLNFSESESFSMTCAEALFFGIPVIAANSGGPAEIIDNNRTGILVENGNVGDMAHAMLLLASDEFLRKTMQENSRIVIREKFSVKNTSALLMAVYNSCLR